MDSIHIYIVIPVYRSLGKETLKKCLSSIASQDYKNYSLYLCVDGDGLNYDELRNKYPITDILYLTENKGPGVARQTVLDRIKKFESNDWITFIDSDDYLPTKSTLSRVARAITHHKNVSMIQFSKYYDDGDCILANVMEFGSLHGVYFNGSVYEEHRQQIRFSIASYFEDWVFRETFRIIASIFENLEPFCISRSMYVAVKNEESITQTAIKEAKTKYKQDYGYLEYKYVTALMATAEMILRLYSDPDIDKHRLRQEVTPIILEILKTYRRFTDIAGVVQNRNAVILCKFVMIMVESFYGDIATVHQYLKEYGINKTELTLFNMAYENLLKPNNDYFLSIIIWFQ